MNRKSLTFLDVALRAWRGITLLQHAWTVGIALVFVLGYLAGLLPEILGATSSLQDPARSGWSAPRFVGVAANGFVVAYSFLLAVRIAECNEPRRRDRAGRYVIAGIGASIAALAMETLLTLLMPSTAGWGNSPVPTKVLGMAAWNAADLALCGGLGLAVYARLRAARLTREAFSAAELERAAANRTVLASRLAATQAQVAPEFLLGTLAHVEALYDRDPGSGGRMLDSLSAYLRASLPQLGNETSTVEREAQLAESYLGIMQQRMGSRLEFTVEFESALADAPFPPMLLLPLIDDALRNGLEPLALGGRIDIRASARGNRMLVTTADDGLMQPRLEDDDTRTEALRERLSGLYGGGARLEFEANTPQGIVAIIEVPREAARSHR